jgi:NhaP-type Na+/H+ or K+/H+ antiporter
MEPFSPAIFILTLALVGVVIIVAALLSGFIDRSDIPQVGVFLALGAMLGPAGLQLLDVSLNSPILRVVATVSLVLVLFTDAVSLSIAEIRRHRLLAFLVIGPGTLLSATFIALAAWTAFGCFAGVGGDDRRCTGIDRSGDAARFVATSGSS